MAIVTFRELSVGFHGPLLLDHVDCQIEAGQKIGLLGRNGSGKTTLMRILRGDLPPDAGAKSSGAPGMRVSLLPQDVPQNVSGTIAEVVAQGLTPGSKAAAPSPPAPLPARRGEYNPITIRTNRHGAANNRSKKSFRGWISTARGGSRFFRRE